MFVGGRVASTKTPGDTAESLVARRRFLQTGSYKPIVDALTSAIGDVDGPILDVGCGEGYYLSHVTGEEKYGLDISKKAIQMASKASPLSQFVVGTSFHLPVLDHSVSVVFTVFAPHSFDEYRRVLRPRGRWVTVTPGPSHLKEMRPHRDMKIEERESRRAQPPADAQSAERLQFTLSLTDDTAHDLFMMTPLQFQQSAQQAVSHIREVSIDVWISSSSLT